MSSEFGNNIKISLFGESHGTCVGGVLSGVPSGFRFDRKELAAFMKRRAGGALYTTPRSEADEVRFLSGVTFCSESGAHNTTDIGDCSDVIITNGMPIAVMIENRNTRSKDYSGFVDTPRPSHADYTALLRFGSECEIRGGGHFSGRLTAPICALGFICKKLLESKGIYIGAHLLRVGNESDLRFDPVNVSKKDFDAVAAEQFPVIDSGSSERMKKVIADAMSSGDSVGAVVECAVTGIAAGFGDPLFEGVENRVAHAVFALGGVRGIEFGRGFEAASMRGSEHNDPFVIEDNCVKTVTNNHSGILGGITSGMPIIFSTVFKPTASISREQDTVSISSMKNTKLRISGRHDPCIGVRAVVCVEAMTSVVMLDLIS